MSKALSPDETTSPKKPAGDLSITALYTSATWSWGGLPGAELLATDEARTVFRITNFALGVTRLFRWKLRSLRHSLLHRHTAIDHLLAEARPARVLELACGLSRRGVAMTRDGAIEYTEVDLPAMIAHKKKLLERTDAGREALARPALHLVEGDVLTTDLRPLVPGEDPLFVIAEGLYMYLTPEQQRASFRDVRALFSGDAVPTLRQPLGDAVPTLRQPLGDAVPTLRQPLGDAVPTLRQPLGDAVPTLPRQGTFVFDLVPACEQPKPGLLGRALGWLMRRFTGGKGFERDSRTREDIAADLREAGFDEVTMVEPSEVAQTWRLPFPNVPTQQLLFVAKIVRRALEAPGG